MEKKLFVAKDKYDGVVITMPCRCAAEFVRFAVPRVARNYFLGDVECLEVGTIDTDTGILTAYTVPVSHTWDEYNFPATEAESLAPLGKDAVDAFKKAAAKNNEKE